MIILGNGFDLAHGLKTSYSDFVEFVLNSAFNEPQEYSDLIVFQGISSYSGFRALNQIMKDKCIKLDVNNLFRKIAVWDYDKNWCDFEELYFNELNNENANQYNIKTLNRDFEIIKRYLYDYLDIESAKIDVKKNDAYELIFNKIKDGTTSVINFNYTDTYKHYFENEKDVINIHGNLKDRSTIIFGYAADNKESNSLLDKGSSEYLKNIKKYRYNSDIQEKRIYKLLKTSDLRIFIFGHSSGLSDKLILSELFNHEKLETINIFYHNSVDDYFDKQVNISRVSRTHNIILDKIITFPESFRMPQHTDTSEHLVDLKKYLDRSSWKDKKVLYVI